MKSGLIKNFIIIGVGSFFSMFLGFITTPIITRLVDPIDYGQFSIFTMYSNLASMVLYLGLDQSMVRFFYDEEGLDYKRCLLYRCMLLPIIITAFSFIAVLILYNLKLIIFEFNKEIFFLLGIYIFIIVIYRFSLLYIRLQYKTKLFSALGVMQKLFYIFFVFFEFCTPIF